MKTYSLELIPEVVGSADAELELLLELDVHRVGVREQKRQQEDRGGDRCRAHACSQKGELSEKPTILKYSLNNLIFFELLEKLEDSLVKVFDDVN